jgi:uncharacterized protein (TIGR02118 family)
MNVVKVCYKRGVRFDESYYLKTHIPLAGGVLGPLGLKQAEIVKIASAADGSAAPYQIVFTAYFDSADALQRALMNPRMAEVMGDLKNFYDGMPDVMVGETIG